MNDTLTAKPAPNKKLDRVTVHAVLGLILLVGICVAIVWWYGKSIVDSHDQIQGMEHTLYILGTVGFLCFWFTPRSSRRRKSH